MKIYNLKRIALALSVTIVALFVMPAVPVEGKTIEREKYMNDKDITELVIDGDVTSIGERAYYGCTNLESVVLSEGVKSIGESAFAMCPKLSYVSIPSTLKHIEPGVFAGDTSLSSLHFPRGNYNFYYVGGALDNPEGTRLISYLPGKEYSFYDMPDQVKHVDNYAFWGSTNLRKVYVSPNVDSITPYDFAYCSALEYVYLPESVERIEECAFRDCKNLKFIYAEDKKIAVDETAFLNAAPVKTVSGTNLAAFNADCVVPDEEKEAELMRQEAMAHQDGNREPVASSVSGSSLSEDEIARGKRVAANSHITSNTHPGNNFGVVDSMNKTTPAADTGSTSGSSSGTGGAGASGSSGTAPAASSSSSGTGGSSSSSGTGGASSSSSSAANTTSANSVSGNSSSSSGTGGSASGPTRIINYNYYDTSPSIAEQLAEYRRKLNEKLSGPYKGGYYGGTYTNSNGIRVNLPDDW